MPLRSSQSPIIAAVATAALLILAAPVGAITPTGDATTLANAALRNTSILSSAVFDLGANANATAVATEPVAGFPMHGSDYPVISSGNAALAPSASQAGAADVNNGGGTRGGAQNVVVMRLNLNVPVGANCLILNFRFFSEEYPDFVGGGFNDGFLAEIDPSGAWTMTNHQITAPSNFAFMPGGAFVSINSAPMTAGDAAGTIYGGGTELLSAATPVTPGAHALVLSVWDDGDTSLDSAAFVDAIQVFTAPSGGCVQGAVADNTPPDTTITSAPTGTSGPVASFSFTATETGSTFECRLDGGPWSACTSPDSPTGLTSGTHTFEVRATDGAGNVDPTPASHTWTVDATPPAAPTILSGPAAVTTSTTGSFAIAGEPNATTECRVDGGAWYACPASFDLSGLALGEHLLQVRQTDLAGNVSQVAEHRWTVERSVPPAPPADPADPAAPASLTGSVGVDLPGSRLPTAVAEGGRVATGCSVSNGRITSCSVVILVGGRIVGRGTARYGPDGVPSGPVEVRLFKGMRRRLARSHRVVKARFEFSARAPGASEPLTTSEWAVIAANRQWILPSDGLFESGSARLVPKVRRYLRAIAPSIRSARRLRCVGHTDSIGTRARNQRLGLRRAQAVCVMLRRLGVRAPRIAASRGETRPRSTNATWAGRWSNRRVELLVQR